MISKNSFFKLQKEDLKRRIWTIALSFLVFFLGLPVLFAIRISNNSSYETRDQILDSVITMIGPSFIFIILITIIGAIVCGLSGFFYLHSRKKVDLYHSIPIRRELLFTVNYIDGVIIYLVPYLINLIITFIVLNVYHYMNGEIFAVALSAIGINLLFYFLIYTIVIIAVMLTGNIVISCFGAAVFLMYGPFIMGLKELYFSEFFITYPGMGRDSDMFQFLSPIGSYVDITNRIAGSEYNGLAFSIFKVILVTIVFLAFSVFLYKKRSSEAASKAMSFAISKPIIKFLLVIPISLFGGIIFRQMAGEKSDGWLIFGIIFGFIISSGIIQVIYEFDIRSFFGKKVQLAVSAVVVVIVVGTFRFDIFHYNTYLPSQDKIAYMSVNIQNLEGNIGYRDFNPDTGVTTYINGSDYQLNNMKITNISSAYSLAVKGVETVKKGSDMDEYYTYKVGYTLKNGKFISRKYNIKLEDSKDELESLFSNKEYKEGCYPLVNWNYSDISGVSCSDFKGNVNFTLNDNEKQELLDTYKSELMSLTLNELRTNEPVATVHFLHDSRIVDGYYVYPSYVKTLAFLKKHGFSPAQIDVNDIKSITIVNYGGYHDTITASNMRYDIGYSNLLDTFTKTYTKKEDIEAIFPSLISSEYSNYNYSFIPVANSLNVVVNFKQDEFGNIISWDYNIKRSQVPDLVKADIGYTEP